MLYVIENTKNKTFTPTKKYYKLNVIKNRYMIEY